MAEIDITDGERGDPFELRLRLVARREAGRVQVEGVIARDDEEPVAFVGWVALLGCLEASAERSLREPVPAVGQRRPVLRDR